MDVAAKRQDLPPPGGYKNINYQRVPAKTYFKGRTIFIGYTFVLVGSSWVYLKTAADIQRDEREYNSATHALLPIYLAETQRIQLRQLVKNRDEERDLMKNVKGWQVGTFYGQPIFKATDMLVPYDATQLYVHTNPKELYKVFSVKEVVM